MVPRSPTRRRLLSMMSAGVVGTLAGCSTTSTDPGTDFSTDWIMAARTPGGTSYSADAAAPRKSAELQWTQPIGHPAGRPTIGDGLVFVPATDALHAFDQETGSSRWRFETGEPSWPTPPAIDEHTAFVGMRDAAEFVALRTQDGTERWSTSLDEVVTTPPILYPGDEWVYIGTESGTLTCLNAASGDIRWQLSMGSRLTALGLRPPLVFVGTEQGDVNAVEWQSGDPLWGQPMASGIQALAIGDGDQVFLGTADGTLARLSGGDGGRTVWTFEAGPVVHNSLVLTRDLVIGSDGDEVTAVGRQNGRKRWRFSGGYTVGPAGAADTVYVGGSESIDAYRLDGGFGVDGVRFRGRRWSHPIDGDPVAGLAVAGGMLFGLALADEQAEVFALGPG